MPGRKTGNFALRYADVVGLGKLNDGLLAIDVTTTAPLALENCTIDSCGKFAFALNGTATASIIPASYRAHTLGAMPWYRRPPAWMDGGMNP